MRTSFSIIYICFLISWLNACQQEEEPNSFQPIIILDEASGITRTKAHLQGKIETAGAHTSITTLQFRYGTSHEMTEILPCAPENRTPEVSLHQLTANTTYYYCLELGNGYQTVQSEKRQFRTLPNRTPSLGTLECVVQGPQSFTLECELLDNGGESITEAGFYYTAQGGQEQQMILQPLSSNTLQGRISQLQFNTSYTLQAYAKNTMGETRSQPLTLQTSHAVIVKEPGRLPEALGNEERYQLNTLQVVGPVNGTDLRAIRDLLGVGIEGGTTPGKLQKLNLTDATICSGGSSYNGSHYSQDYVIGKNLFSGCRYLTELSLPDNTKIIEQDAIRQCAMLRKLHLPTSVQEAAPSTDCPQLEEITVSANHRYFLSSDGILYNRSGQTIIWFPEGKKEATFLPSVVKIGQKAFQNCRIKDLKIPDTVTFIGDGAFAGAHFESISLPRGIQLITKGLFQGCKQLSQVTLSPKTSYLEDYCFEGCPLQHLYVPVEEFPPHCTEHTFQSMHYAHCLLHVPAPNLNYYHTGKIWGQFQQIQGDIQ